MSHSPQVVQRSGPLCGRVRVPGDKSISHRAIMLGAIAHGTTKVSGFLPAEDCLATLRAVRALGVDIQELGPTEFVIRGTGGSRLAEPQGIVDCGSSGTTMRLLAGLLAAQPFFSVLSGTPQLLGRPMRRIVEPLRQMGASVFGRAGGRFPPLAVHGSQLRGITHTLPVASAQVKSALLLAGLNAEGMTTLRVPGPARDHTERMMASMGVELEVTGWSPETDGQQLTLRTMQRLHGTELVVPGDLSSAAFLIVAALLIPGSDLIIEDVGINPTRSGVLDVLMQMGADIAALRVRSLSGEPVADLRVRSSTLVGTTISRGLVVRAIDELPILAVAATQAHGETLVRDASELRVKETDRIAVTAGELLRLGARIEPQADGFAVRGPTPLQGTLVESHGDHRLAMSLAVAGLIARGSTCVGDFDCSADSFPGFLQMLERSRGAK